MKINNIKDNYVIDKINVKLSYNETRKYDYKLLNEIKWH